MMAVKGFTFHHNFSTTKGLENMSAMQDKRIQRVRRNASSQSGGHGARTRNRLPGTTFPVSPLAIRLPSGHTRQLTGDFSSSLLCLQSVNTRRDGRTALTR
jgi:hypothetical protein